MTIISADTVFKGEIDSQNTVQIDGRFEGTIRSKAAVIVSEGGVSRGDIDAVEIHVFGKLHGKIVADKVAIGPRGDASATIISDNLSIAEGGRFAGEKRYKTTQPEEQETLQLNEASA